MGHIDVGAEHQSDGSGDLGRARAADVRGYWYSTLAHAVEIGQVRFQKMILHKPLGARERPTHQRAVLQRDRRNPIREWTRMDANCVKSLLFVFAWMSTIRG